MPTDDRADPSSVPKPCAAKRCRWVYAAVCVRACACARAPGVFGQALATLVRVDDVAALVYALLLNGDVRRSSQRDRSFRTAESVIYHGN